jgi:hypothetical protein
LGFGSLGVFLGGDAFSVLTGDRRGEVVEDLVAVAVLLLLGRS